MPSTAYLTFCVVLGVVLCFGLWTITFGRDRLVYFGFELSEYQPTGFLYFLYFGAIFMGCSSPFFQESMVELEYNLEMYVFYAMAVIVYQTMDYLWQSFDKSHLDDIPKTSWLCGGFCLYGAIIFALPGEMLDGQDPYYRPFGVLFYLSLSMACLFHVSRKLKNPEISKT